MQPATAFNLDRTVAILMRTPGSLAALFRGLPDFWVQQNEGGETWSAVDIIGHLIFADHTDWMPRVRRILEHGEQVPFDPFDRLGHVALARGKTFDQLLTEFAEVRNRSLAELAALNLQPQDLERRGKHPALGTVTVAELLATWAVHDLNHVHQLSRVLAHQYGTATGPFQAYLGVLHCNGHGA